MSNPILCLVVPLGDGWPGYPSQGLPVGPGHVAPPIFHPGHPDHGLPSVPGHPSTGPIYPGGHPGNRPPGSGEYPTGGPVVPPLGGPVHPWVPPAGSEIPKPPEEIAYQVVIAIWNPATETWTVGTAPAAQPK
jgi:hypothetical protein